MSAGNQGNEHPFISIEDVKQQLTVDEVQGKLKVILERLNFAYSTGNQPLINQLNMARATYTRAHNEMLDEMFTDSDINGEVEGKIDIS